MNTGDAVQQLLDLEAIKTLKHRYIRCMTQSRWDELETLLAPGVEASYSDGKYVFSDRASLMGFLRQQDPAGVPQLSYWHVTMPEITLHAPDRASGIWAMYHFHLRKNEQQQRMDQARSSGRNLSNPKCQFWLQQDQTAPSEKSRANVLQFCD